MIKFIFKRILMIIPIMMGVVFVVFSMMYFSPGEPAIFVLGDMATPEDIAMFNAEHGLDRPFIVQYINYMLGVVQGDFGISYTTRQPVIYEILERFPTTFQLALLSTLIAIVIGVTMGIVSAVKQYSIWDNFASALSIVGVSMPSFWQGLLLILLFSVYLDWLPPSGFATWRHWILPSVTIGTSTAAIIMRMTRSSMLEAIRQDYIRTARAKGQTEFIIIWHHAFRNAIIPVMTIVGINFGRMLGGSAIVEVVFSVPGLGNLIVHAINFQNAPLVQGGILFIAIAMAICNLIVDVLYAYADPRIRSQYVKPKHKIKIPQLNTCKEVGEKNG